MEEKGYWLWVYPYGCIHSFTLQRKLKSKGLEFKRVEPGTIRIEKRKD